MVYGGGMCFNVVVHASGTWLFHMVVDGRNDASWCYLDEVVLMVFCCFYIW